MMDQLKKTYNLVIIKKACPADVMQWSHSLLRSQLFHFAVHDLRQIFLELVIIYRNCVAIQVLEKLDGSKSLSIVPLSCVNLEDEVLNCVKKILLAPRYSTPLCPPRPFSIFKALIAQSFVAIWLQKTKMGVQIYHKKIRI